MTRAARNRSRGFAMVMAIFLLGFVGLAIAIMTASFARQAKRTREVQADAQLRQMLLAGAQSVADRSRNWPAEAKPGGWTVRLPGNLADNGGQLSIEISHPTTVPAAGTTLLAKITAKLEKRQLRQSLTIQQDGGKWRITGARLD